VAEDEVMRLIADTGVASSTDRIDPRLPTTLYSPTSAQRAFVASLIGSTLLSGSDPVASISAKHRDADRNGGPHAEYQYARSRLIKSQSRRLRWRPLLQGSRHCWALRFTSTTPNTWTHWPSGGGGGGARVMGTDGFPSPARRPQRPPSALSRTFIPRPVITRQRSVMNALKTRYCH